MKYILAALALAGLSSAQSSLPECSGASTVTVVPTAVSQYPVVISTYIANNGIININNIQITINNAPTTLSTTVTATSTVYSTVTAAATPTATTIAEPIILAINSNIAKHKRQTGYAGYLGASASVATTCGAAQPLTLTNGQLFTTSGLQFSADVDEASITFEASSTVGAITTTFGVNGVFIWTNGNFSGGEAQFCQSSSTGSIYAGLTGSVSDCVAISFTAILASSCSNSTSSGTASSTGASMTSSATSSSISSSSAITNSSSSSSSSISVSPSTTSVSLAFPAPSGTSSKEKRQTTLEYLTTDGTFTSNSSDAGIFSIVNGMMYSGSAFFAADSTDEYKVFVADSTGSLDVTFQASPFEWYNGDFGVNSANTAEFGIASGTVYAALQTFPGFLTSIQLTALAASTSSSASSTASSSSSSATATITSGTSTSSVSSSSSSTTASSGVTSSANSTATGVARRYNMPQLH